jgi:hypothetical protein
MYMQQMNHGALNKTRPRCLAGVGVLMAALSELLPYLECSKNKNAALCSVLRRRLHNGGMKRDVKTRKLHC